MICISSALLTGYTAPLAGLPLPQPGTALNPTASGGEEFKCEICMLVAQQREDQAAGGECSSVKPFMESCATVLRAFDLWSKWVNLWLRDLGCHKVSPSGLALARPCPGHAVCSWITSPIDQQPFCANDPAYQSPAPLPARAAAASPVQTVEQQAQPQNAAAWSSPQAVAAAWGASRTPPTQGGAPGYSQRRLIIS